MSSEVRDTQNDSHDPQHRVDINYATFWNEFSHYAVYKEGVGEHIEAPVDYSQMDNKNDHTMFEDENMYVEGQVSGVEDLVKIESHPYFKSRQENTLNFFGNEESSHLNLYAHIPQDYNLDIEVTGNIKGLNPGESKFHGSEARLVTTGRESTIEARRLRTDDCFL
jgi:hypothetical protein